MRIGRTVKTVALLNVSVLCMWVTCAAQSTVSTNEPGAPQATQKPRKATTPGTAPVIVQDRAAAPQVVTILHRLTGLKMFRLLLRSNAEMGAIAKLDDAFKITDEVHTNVIAGLALDDGQTIAAWLPDAAAEVVPPPAPFDPAAPAPPMPPAAQIQPPRATTVAKAPRAGLIAPGAMSFFDRPDLTVVARDGKRLIARYVGLDAMTGLSVLKLSEKSSLHSLDAAEDAVGIGQRLRLFAPEPVAPLESRASTTIYVRIGETVGTVVNVKRAPSGAIARVTINARKLSAANIGGIVLNSAGQTVGIVETVEGNEATVLPSALVRSAARRVIERQASVPKPWLGIRGEPIGKLQIDQLQLRGWLPESAKALAEMQRGILLTSVAPGSPAAVAALRPGDVILSANEEVIKSAEDLSWLLEEAGPGGSVQFQIARPGKLAAEAVELKLSESPEPFFGLKRYFEFAWPDTSVEPLFKGSLFESLIVQGIETIALKPRVATRFGANGGLLVVYVHPNTSAFKAGLRSGDVIEAIDGRQVSPSITRTFSVKPNGNYSFSIVRNREKLVVTVVSSN